MSNRDHVETTYIIQPAALSLLPEPVQVRLIISRLAVSDSESQRTEVDAPIGQHPPFTRQFTTMLSEENWQRLRNLSYWQPGRANSQVAILNKALALYLASHEESRQPIPEGEELR